MVRPALSRWLAIPAAFVAALAIAAGLLPREKDEALCEDISLLQRYAPDGFSVDGVFITLPFRHCSYAAAGDSPVRLSCAVEVDIPEKDARRAAKHLHRQIRRCIGAEVVDERTFVERMREPEDSVSLVRDGVEHRIEVAPSVLAWAVHYDVMQEYSAYEQAGWREEIEGLRERMKRGEWCEALVERSRAIGDCGHGLGAFSCTVAETREEKLLESVFDELRDASVRCGFRPSSIDEGDEGKQRVRIASFLDSRGEVAFELIQAIEQDEGAVHAISIIVITEEP